MHPIRARARLASWDTEVDLAAVRTWVPTTGAEKPKLDHDACDEAISCIQRLLRDEAANVDGCRDVFMVDPLVPTQACPAAEASVPLTQEAMGNEAPPAKRLRREKELSREDFAQNTALAKSILLYLLKSGASRVTVRVILDVTKLKQQCPNSDELEAMARNVFRLGAAAGLATLGPQGGTWTTLRPPSDHETAVEVCLQELFDKNVKEVLAALKKRAVAEAFDMPKCQTALALLR